MSRAGSHRPWLDPITGYGDVIHGYYPQAIGGDGTTFETVFLLDVLEHVIDPWAMLERVRTDRAPGGSVVAAIPSAQGSPPLGSGRDGGSRTRCSAGYEPVPGPPGPSR